MSKKNQKNAGSKKGSFATLLVILIAIGACALAGYTLYEMKKIKSEVAMGNQSQKLPESTAPMYIPLDTFTVSLKPTENDSDRVLYIGLTLRVADENSKLLIEKYMPEIRSRLLFLFAQETAEHLSSDEGRVALAQEIKKEFAKPLSVNQNAVVSDVLFNAFIIR